MKYNVDANLDPSYNIIAHTEPPSNVLISKGQ